MINNTCKYKFDTVEFNELPEDIEDQFVLEYENDFQEVWVTKDLYTHEEEGLKFNYKYVVNVEWIDGNVYITIHLVVAPESLSKERQDMILEFTGGYLEYRDIINYGVLSVVIGSEVIEGEEDEDIEEIWRRTKDKIKCAMYSVQAINGMRGFYLDRLWNAYGTTGWHTIRYALGLEENPYLNKKGVIL